MAGMIEEGATRATRVMRAKATQIAGSGVNGFVYTDTTSQKTIYAGNGQVAGILDNTEIARGVEHEHTERDLDIDLHNGVLAIVSDAQGLRATCNGNLNLNSEGYLVDSNGNKVAVVASKDALGQMPDRGKIKNFNIQNAALQGTQTTVVTSKGNLCASTTPMLAPGVVLDIGKATTDMIDGSKIVIKDNNNKTSTFIYSQGAYSKTISAQYPIFGATSHSAQFIFGTGANQLAQGAKLTINVGTNKFDFVASTNASNQENFHSLDTLASAINKVANRSLSAKVTSDNRIQIIATDGNNGISFNDDQGGLLARNLDLYDVSAAVAGQIRYSSAEDLMNKVNATDGLIATKQSNGVLRISSDSASKPINIDIFSNTDPRVANAAHIGLSGTTYDASNLITVSAPNSGLKDGDFVKITDFAPSGTAIDLNGIYRVSFSNKDYFVISTGDTETLGKTTAVTSSKLISGSAFKYQKIAGALGESKTQNTQFSYDTANVDEIKLRLNDLGCGYNGANLAADDIIHIAVPSSACNPGGGIFASGTYKITAVAGLDITIKALSGRLLQPPSVVANIAAAPANGVIIQKTGVLNANKQTTKVFEVAAWNPGNPIPNVKVYIPNNAYKKGDTVTFPSLGAPDGLAIGPCLLKSDGTYKVAAVDPLGRWIEVTADAVAPAPAANANSISKNADDLNSSGVINERAITIKQLGSSLDDLEKAKSMSYSPLDPTKNMTNGTVSMASVSKTEVTIYDSLGKDHKFILAFGKHDTGTNKYAVEIYPSNPNEVISASQGVPIAYGDIEFDANGKILDSSKGVITARFDWKNAASTSDVRFDFGSMSSTNARTIAFPPETDGKAAAIAQKVKIEADGAITVTAENGESYPYGFIITGRFVNFNQAEIDPQGYIVATRGSGDFMFNPVGNGDKICIPGGLRASAADQVKALSDLSAESLNAASLSAAAALLRHTERDIVETAKH